MFVFTAENTFLQPDNVKFNDMILQPNIMKFYEMISILLAVWKNWRNCQQYRKFYFVLSASAAKWFLSDIDENSFSAL